MSTRAIEPIVERKAGGRKPEEKTPWSGHDGRCQHEYNAERCPFPGNIKDEGRWLCLHHVDSGNRANDTEQSRFYQRFNPNDQHGRECIKDMLEDWYPDTLERRVQQLMMDHPQWFRQPGEGRTEYNRRMFDNARPLRAGAVQRTKEAGGEA